MRHDVPSMEIPGVEVPPIRTGCAIQGCPVHVVHPRHVVCPDGWNDLGRDETGRPRGFACPYHRVIRDVRVEDYTVDESHTEALRIDGVMEARRLMAMQAAERDAAYVAKVEAMHQERQAKKMATALRKAREIARAQEEGQRLDAEWERRKLAARVRRRFEKAGALSRRQVTAWVAEKWPDMAADEMTALVAEVMNGGGA